MNAEELWWSEWERGFTELSGIQLSSLDDFAIRSLLKHAEELADVGYIGYEAGQLTAREYASRLSTEISLARPAHEAEKHQKAAEIEAQRAKVEQRETAIAAVEEALRWEELHGSSKQIAAADSIRRGFSHQIAEWLVRCPPSREVLEPILAQRSAAKWMDFYSKQRLCRQIDRIAQLEGLRQRRAGNKLPPPHRIPHPNPGQVSLEELIYDVFEAQWENAVSMRSFRATCLKLRNGSA